MCVRAVRAAVIVLTGCVCVSVAGEKKTECREPERFWTRRLSPQPRMPLRVWSRSAPFCACAPFKLPINAHCRGCSSASVGLVNVLWLYCVR